jgi:hypothetical protein
MREHLTASQERYRRRLRGQQAEYLAGVGKPRTILTPEPERIP